MLRILSLERISTIRYNSETGFITNVKMTIMFEIVLYEFTGQKANFAFLITCKKSSCERFKGFWRHIFMTKSFYNGQNMYALVKSDGLYWHEKCSDVFPTTKIILQESVRLTSEVIMINASFVRFWKLQPQLIAPFEKRRN